MLHIYFTALGCKLNQAELEMLAREAGRHGVSIMDTPQEADWAVINTCTVTQTAAQKTRQAIRHLHQQNPRMRIVATGCHATIAPQELMNLPGIALVLPNASKEDVIKEICTAENRQLAATASNTVYHGRRTRAQVKIQDGCDNHCAYCIVCIARGPQRSIAPDRILEQVKARQEEGYQEIVLTGVHIGAYGRDSAENAVLPPEAGWNLAKLVRLLLTETKIPRLRLGSIEPWDFTDELLALWPNERLCRHVHLPIQSGADTVLQRMGRNYDSAYLACLAAKILKRIPEMAITTDLIAGFPGESEAEHTATLDLVQRLNLARLHVFAFSSRPGTPAATMPGQLAPEVIKRRSQELIALGQEQARSFRSRYLGQTVKVLFERPQMREGQLLESGLTDNYLRVYTPADLHLHNEFHAVRCTKLCGDGIIGELV